MNTYFSSLAKRSGITPEPAQTVSSKTQHGIASEPGKRSTQLMENSEPTYYVENASSTAGPLAPNDATQERKPSIATTGETEKVLRTTNHGHTDGPTWDSPAATLHNHSDNDLTDVNQLAGAKVEVRTDSSLRQTQGTESNNTSQTRQAANPPGSQHQPSDNSLSSRSTQSGSLEDSTQGQLQKPAEQSSAPTVGQSASSYKGDVSKPVDSMRDDHATPTTFVESPSPPTSGVAAKRVGSIPAPGTENVMPLTKNDSHRGVQVHIGKIELEVLAPPAKTAPPSAPVTQVIPQAPARAAAVFNPHRHYLRRG